jgi:hypothetical protein
VASPLDTYERARQSARAIRDEVLQGRMPPWTAATGLGDYVNDPRPTPTEIEILTAWADGGTPRGSTDSEVSTIVPNSEGAAPHIVVQLPRAHPSRAAVERLTVTLGGESMTIGGWEYRPGDARAIMRAVFLADGAPIGSWAAPDARVTYPRGVALAVRRGAAITAELHYRKSRAAEVDAGTLVLYEGRAGEPPRYRAFTCGTTVLERAVQVLTITPAAGEAGAFIEVVARRPDRSVEPLAAVMRYLPGYPATYRVRTPVALPRGTTIDVRSSAAACAAGIEFIATRPAPAASLRR